MGQKTGTSKALLKVMRRDIKIILMDSYLENKEDAKCIPEGELWNTTNEGLEFIGLLGRQ